MNTLDEEIVDKADPFLKLVASFQKQAEANAEVDSPKNKAVLDAIASFVDRVHGKSAIVSWILVRALVCTGAVMAAISVLFAITVTFVPFVQLLAGASFWVCLMWLALPILLPIAWASSEIAWFVYREYIDYEL